VRSAFRIPLLCKEPGKPAGCDEKQIPRFARDDNEFGAPSERLNTGPNAEYDSQLE
jgi:hypothetical protein